MQSDHTRYYVIINRTLNNNRVGSASKRSIDLANKKAREIKGYNTELTDPQPYKPSPSYICSEQTICMSAT